MSSGVLRFLAGLVVGGVIGFLVARSSFEPPAPRADTDLGPADAVDPGTGSGTESSLDTAPEGDAPAEPAPAPTLESPGAGRIRGRVATSSGQGVGGITLVASIRSVRSGAARVAGEPPEQISIDEAVQRAVDDAKRRHASERRTLTSPDGAYVLEGLADEPYSLAAYGEGYELRPERGQGASSVKPGATVDFVAKGVVQVTFEVSDPDGQPPERALIRRAPDREALSRAGGSWWTEDRPTLRVEPGTHWFQAVAGEHRDMISEPQEVTLEPGVPTRLVFALTGRPGIRGRVLYPESFQGPNVDVYALRFDGETPPDLKALAVGDGRIRGRYDRRDQTYEFRDLAPGRYLVGAGLDIRMGVDATAVVTVRDRTVAQDMTMPAIDPAAWKSVSVTGPDGEPLDDVRFSVRTRGPRLSASGPGTPLRREDGSWYVRVPRWDALGTRQYNPDELDHTLVVTSRSLGGTEVALDPASTEPIEIRMQAPGRLDITFEGYRGSPLFGHVTVYLHRRLDPDGSGWSGAGAAVTPEGRCAIDKVQPGAYFVILRLGGLGAVETYPIEVDSGEQSIVLPVPECHTLTVEPPPGQPEAPRMGLRRLARHGTWMVAFAAPDESGKVVFACVPAGRYELEGSYDGETRKVVVDVSRETVVQFP